MALPPNAAPPVLSLIVAMARNGVIGIENRLPWRLPADLGYFKQVTMGKPIVMGRNTYESIGRPLPGRQNIVVTRQAGYAAPGCTVVHGLPEALDAAADSAEVMVIGGAALYAQALALARRLYVTVIDAEFAGDARFPAIDPRLWREVQRRDCMPDEANPYRYSFVVLEPR